MTHRPNIVVVDMDGTLCNSGHREHHARAGEWERFHGQLMEDEPWADVQAMLQLLDGAGYMVIGLTGRNERYRAQTMYWLGKHDVHLDDLLMRPNDDYQSDHDLKPKLLDAWLEEHGHSHAEVWLILEDREKMVEAWRNLGHNCWAVRASGY